MLEDQQQIARTCLKDGKDLPVACNLVSWRFLATVFKQQDPLRRLFARRYAVNVATSMVGMDEQDWLAPAAIDPRTLYESNSVLRGGHKGPNANPLHTSNCIVRPVLMEPARWVPQFGKDTVYEQMLTEPGIFAIIYGRPVVQCSRFVAAA